MSFERLSKLMDSEDPEIRRQTVAESAELQGKHASDRLMTGLADEDWRVRKEAVQALAVRPADAHTLGSLVRALHPGENVGLRNAAVEALGGFGTLAVEALARALPALDADGKKLAAEALARTNHVAALGPLEQLVQDGDPNVHAAAIEGLADVGRVAPEAALPILEAALEQTNTFSRLVTLDAIRRLGLTPSWARLRPLLSEPILLPVGLQLAAALGEPKAAPYFVKQLVACRGQIWRETLVSFAGFIERSQATLEQSREALRHLPRADHEKLGAACEQRGDSEAVSAALLVLAAEGREPAADPAIRLLGDDQVGAAGHRALEILGSGAMASLRRHLASGEELERVACIELLSGLAQRDDLTDDVLQALRELANDPSPSVARAWLSVVSSIGDEGMFIQCLSWLTDTSAPHVRRAAVSAVRACALRFPETARQLAAKVSPDAPEAASVATFIAALDQPVLSSYELDLQFLIAAVSNASLSARVSALSALSGFSDEVAVEAIGFALNDEAQEVQLSAVRALGCIRTDDGKPLGTQSLVRVVQGEDSALTVAALQPLGESKDPAALPILTALVGEPQPWRAVAAVEALGTYAFSERTAAMQVALDHPESEVVKAALSVLGSDQRSGEDALIRCLSHRAWDVRRLAADSLARRGEASSRLALKAHLATEREPLVIEAIRRGLSRFESRSSLLSLSPLQYEEDT